VLTQEVRVPEAGAATCSGPLEGKGGVRGFARRDGGKGGKCGGAGACMYLCELSGAELIGKERETKKEWTFGPDAIWDRRGGLPPARPMLQARGARGASRAKGA